MNAGKIWWTSLTNAEQHGHMEASREAWRQLSQSVQEQIRENLGMHAEVARTVRSAKAKDRYLADGRPEIVPNLSAWDCTGCNLECS